MGDGIDGGTGGGFSNNSEQVNGQIPAHDEGLPDVSGALPPASPDASIPSATIPSTSPEAIPTPETKLPEAFSLPVDKTEQDHSVPESSQDGAQVEGFDLSKPPTSPLDPRNQPEGEQLDALAARLQDNDPPGRVTDGPLMDGHDDLVTAIQKQNTTEGTPAERAAAKPAKPSLWRAFSRRFRR